MRALNTGCVVLMMGIAAGISCNRTSSADGDAGSVVGEISAARKIPVESNLTIGHVTDGALRLVYADTGKQTLFQEALSARTVDSMALALSGKLFLVKDPGQIIGVINKAIFNEMNIGFDSCRDDIANMFPRTVVMRKKGSCLGISLLYLQLAEKLDLPFHGVLIPGHFFVRYDDGNQVVNVETMKNGRHFDNEWYCRKFNVDTSQEKPLHNLTVTEVQAALYFNIGNHFLSQAAYGKAAACYLAVVDVLDGLAEAWGNLGIAYDALGESEKALAAIEEARRICPRLRNVSRNLGTLYVRRGKFERALMEYEQGLSVSPQDPDLLYGAAFASMHLKKYQQAARYAQTALDIRPEFPDARELVARARLRLDNTRQN